MTSALSQGLKDGGPTTSHGGGVAAQVVLLLEVPGPRSVEPRGSGIISANNNDDTAANLFRLREEAHLRRDRIVAWNIVPWFLESGSAWKNATPEDAAEAAGWLDWFVDLLPALEGVVSMGIPARDGWLHCRKVSTVARTLPFDDAPHPSPRNLNTRPEQRPEILAALARVAARLPSSGAL